MVATDNDNGRHIQLRSGQVFDIVLADDYDQTGCQWRDEQGHNDAIVHLLGQRYQLHHAPPAGKGNGTNTERYQAQQTGTVQVRLVESDNAGKVCRRYAVDVTVGPRSLKDTLTSGVKQVAAVAIPIASLVIVGFICLLVYRKLKSK
jgi:predicted secreted protein